MDVNSGKRAVGGIAAPKRRPVISKDTAGSQSGTAAQLCNRIGCCGRLNNSKGNNKNKCLEKPKPLKASLRLSASKEVIQSSSKVVKKPLVESEKKVLPKIEKIPAESSSVSSASTIEAASTLTSRAQLKLKSKSSVSDQNSESNNGRKKRFTQGESSSSGKGKRVIGVSPNEGRVSEPKSSRNLISCRTNGVSSVRTPRKSLNQLNGDDFSLVKSSNASPERPQAKALSVNGGSSTSDTSSIISSASSTDRTALRFVDENGTRHYNIDGIADVLLALDRIEQDQELTYEQLLSLEANLFLGGLNLYDQHRDMRLDIDNMSYEELLVLEEKMGTVSTALSEEQLSKCIKTSIYESLPLEDEKTWCSLGADDNKCSICQEEFVRGDQIGKIGCGHGYHAPCINQWLSLKNWCPICKASPEP
uniref:E3 ubiquitin-protein ligase Praja-2-like n=1 Tax=Erigeron canadensis TaxID=72917 RepID=UPI001CB8E358|nr:E3 ubiquitin-protein ligase Praja-2-like [Erigeron canadensis]